MNDHDDDVVGQQEDVRKRSDPGGTSQEKPSAPNGNDTFFSAFLTTYIEHSPIPSVTTVLQTKNDISMFWFISHF